MFDDPESRKCRDGADLLVMVGGVVCYCVMLKTLVDSSIFKLAI